MLGVAKLRRVRGEGRRAKVRGSEGIEQGGVLEGVGNHPYPQQLEVLGSVVSSPSGVRVKPRQLKDLLAF